MGGRDYARIASGLSVPFPMDPPESFSEPPRMRASPEPFSEPCSRNPPRPRNRPAHPHSWNPSYTPTQTLCRTCRNVASVDAEVLVEKYDRLGSNLLAYSFPCKPSPSPYTFTACVDECLGETDSLMIFAQNHLRRTRQLR